MIKAAHRHMELFGTDILDTTKKRNNLVRKLLYVVHFFFNQIISKHMGVGQNKRNAKMLTYIFRK